MKYARPILITFSIVIAVSVAVAVAAAVAIAVAILNGLTVYNSSDAIDPVIAASTFYRNKSSEVTDEVTDKYGNTTSSAIISTEKISATLALEDEVNSEKFASLAKNNTLFY